MTITSILWYFAVYCILRGNSETIPEIAYEVQNIKNEVLLLPLNNVPVKRNQTAKYNTFVLMEGSDATIALYGKTTLTLVGISVYSISENWRVNLDQVFYAKENSHKYYVKIPQILSFMAGDWDITFRFNSYKDISKTITVHTRPSEVSKVPIVSAQPDNLIATQIASYTIKDFDAFGCLVYKDQDDLAMRCKHSTSKTNLMEWSPNAVQSVCAVPKTYRAPIFLGAFPDSLHVPLLHRYRANQETLIKMHPFEEHCSTTSGRAAAYYKNRLKLIHDGSYVDCIQHVIGDTITVRIFLVLSSPKSWPNNNSVKPISNDDREGCVKYVSSLYGPEALKQNDYFVKPTHTEPDSGNKIKFQIARTQNQFNLLSVNGRHDHSTKLDTFTVFEGEQAIIKISYNSSDISVEKVIIFEANTNNTIITKEIEEEIDSLYALQIKSDHSQLSRIWRSQIFARLVSNNESLKLIHKFQIHIRPNEDGMPRVHTNNKIIPIQRANSSFHDFDGFGCILYDSHASLDLYCRKSRTNSTGIDWKAGTKTISTDYCGNSDFCMVSLNLPQTGTIQMDCTEQLSEDITTVRIFFIHNNNDINIPSSEKDRAGCLNYVTGYISPDNTNREPKTISPDNFRKRQKDRPQKTNISSSPTPQNGPTGNHFSHIHHKPGPPAEHPTSPWQPNTNHRWNNTPRSPNKSPSPNIIFPEPPPPPSKHPSHFEHNTNAHRQSHLNNNDKPPNAKTDKDLNNKNVSGWWPKQSTAIDSPIANSTLSTPTVFHDFKNKTRWPALGPETDTARQSQSTTVVPDITPPPPPPSEYTLVIVSVLTILVVILMLTILYMKCKFKKYWTSNMPTEPRYANDKSEFNNDRQPLRENVENNIYVDSDSGTVQYMNNIPDIYAKPVPKSQRNVQVNHERAETNVLVDNSVYEGSDIYAEPNYDAIGKQSNTGTPCNEEYSYAYADASCIRPLVNNTCDKTYDYATINERGQDTYAEVQKKAKYSNINTNNTNGVSKDYVNDTSYLNTKQKGSVDIYANTSDRYYANRSEF